jgi:hypothetical protein
MSPQPQSGTHCDVRDSGIRPTRPPNPTQAGVRLRAITPDDARTGGPADEDPKGGEPLAPPSPKGRTASAPITDTVVRRTVIGPSGTIRSTSGSTPITQGTLALNLEIAPELPAVPVLPAPAMLRLVGSEAAPEKFPDIYRWAPRLVQAVAEVISGDRPIGQLIRWTDSDVYADLHRRVRVLGLTTTATGRGSEDRAVVRSVHVCYPKPDVAEVAAHVRHGGRSRAVALRLEVHRNRWVCTALRIG